MKFKRMLVLIFLTLLYVYTIQQNANPIVHWFSKINIYCRQNFANKRIAAQSHIQCASNCVFLFNTNCKAYLWNEIGKTCMTAGETVINNNALESEIYNIYKDGCTNKGYFYDLHSNMCLKMFLDSDGKTWKDARNHCQANGGDLISLTTPSKWEFVIQFTSCQTNMWIGLKDKLWVTNATFENVFNVSVQLNDHDGRYSNDSEPGCGKFSIRSKPVLQDESCNERLKNIYVCEILV